MIMRNAIEAEKSKLRNCSIADGLHSEESDHLERYYQVAFLCVPCLTTSTDIQGQYFYPQRSANKVIQQTIMGKYVFPKRYYLHVHDILKKIDPSFVVHAYISNRKPFQSEMACLTTKFNNDPEFVRDIALRVQDSYSNADVVAKKQRIDIYFNTLKDHLSVNFGVPGITIDDVNAEPTGETRRLLRSSLGFDEERFIKTAPPMASLAAALCAKTIYDYYPHTPELNPPVTYWLAHCYRMMEAYPGFDHHQLVYGSVMDKFTVLFEREKFINPFCDGEDMNTMRAAANLCRAMRPNWDGKIDKDDIEAAESEMRRKGLWIDRPDEIDAGEMGDWPPSRP